MDARVARSTVDRSQEQAPHPLRNARQQVLPGLPQSMLRTEIRIVGDCYVQRIGSGVCSNAVVECCRTRSKGGASAVDPIAENRVPVRGGRQTNGSLAVSYIIS